MSAGGDAAEPAPAAALLWCPFGDEESARAVASALIAEGLVACANIFPGLVSIYRWEGAVAEAGEAGVLFKTTALLLGQASERLAQLHPYDVPAIVGWEAQQAPRATLAWLAQNTRQEDRE